jgi:GIY-YIG catalytic domain
VVARWAHNPKVIGSNPVPATKKPPKREAFFVSTKSNAMFFVYVLFSLKDGRLYKGFTSNIQNRLLKHNSGGSTSTAHRKPFVLVHIEQFELKHEKNTNYL